MTLVMKRSHYDQIVAHAKEVHPVEACGLLVGSKEAEKRIVSEVRRTPNVLDSMSRYEVSPEVQLQIFLEAEKRGLEVIGIYHSHPHWAAAPSDIDANLAAYPNVSYVIYSVSENSIASYVWNGATFLPEKLEIQ